MDFDVFVGTKNMTAKTSDPSLKGSVSLQYFLGRSGGNDVTKVAGSSPVGTDR